MLKTNNNYFFIDNIDGMYVLFYGKLINMIPKLDWRAGNPANNPNLKCDCYCIFECEHSATLTVKQRVASSETLNYFDTYEEYREYIKRYAGQAIFYDESIIYFLSKQAK